MESAQHNQPDIESCIAAELERRFAEDEANPHDTITWEAIRIEAHARWRHQSRRDQ